MKDSRGKIIYTYDGRNRLSGVRYENGIGMTYRYDPAGNLVGCMVSDQAEAVAAGSSGLPSSEPVHTVDKNVLCTRCGHPVTAGKKFCANCGTPLNAPAPAVPDTPQPPLVCPACSGPLKAGARFCRACGTKIG